MMALFRRHPSKKDFIRSPGVEGEIWFKSGKAELKIQTKTIVPIVWLEAPKFKYTHFIEPYSIILYIAYHRSNKLISYRSSLDLKYDPSLLND